MKRKTLLDALEKLFPAVASKPIVEEMGCFRFAGPELRSTDGMLAIRVTMDEDSGLHCLIHAEHILKLLRSMTDEDIDLAIDGESLRVQGKKLRGNYTISKAEDTMLDTVSFDADEWQDVPKGLLKGIHLCAFAASKDATRGALCGVCLRGNRVLASDAFRIAQYVVDGAGDLSAKVGAGGVCLRPALCRQLRRHGDKLAKWAVRDDTVLFTSEDGSVAIASKLFPSEFPDAEGWVKKADDLKASCVFPEATAEAVRRHLEQMADVDDDSRQVRVSLAGKEVKITSKDGVTYELEDTLEMETAADKPLAFAVHPAYLLDILDRTRRMHYGDADQKMVAFKAEPLTYVAGVVEGK